MIPYIPPKLKKGDVIRVISPSRSYSIISKQTRAIAYERFKKLGLKVSFGKHVEETDKFLSSSIQSRVADLHDAFLNPQVKGIIAVIGGYNSNQLLNYIDWSIVKNNPKIFLGFSDITTLQTAMLTQANLATYYGPNFADFGQQKYFEYSLHYIKLCLMENSIYSVISSKTWTDDLWYIDQLNRHNLLNTGPIIINKGAAHGIIMGGNLCALNLLQGTKYFPDLQNSILFIEDDEATSAEIFDRELQSLINQSTFHNIKGICIGRFQKKSAISDKQIIEILKSKKELDYIPIAYNINFGHTNPKITFPIGGEARIVLLNNIVKITITKH